VNADLCGKICVTALGWSDAYTRFHQSHALGRDSAKCWMSPCDRHRVNFGDSVPPGETEHPNIKCGSRRISPQPPRIMVPSGVTPQQLIGIFNDEKYTHDQAVRMTEPYMGKWMRFTGTINDIVVNKSSLTTPRIDLRE
jgi:hypothetical protein